MASIGDLIHVQQPTGRNAPTSITLPAQLVNAKITQSDVRNEAEHEYELGISNLCRLPPKSTTRAKRLDLPKGLRDRNSPTCTLSQNGYGERFVRLALFAQLCTRHCPACRQETCDSSCSIFFS